MEVAALIDQLEQHGTALATAADRAGPDTAVPNCPDWDVRALLAHIGMVHRWAAGIVRGEADAAGNNDFPAPQDGIVDWFRDGHAALVSLLRGSPASLEAWTFLPAPSPLAFWARRQAHETAIHRADAESAYGWIPSFDAEFAADGLAELLEGFQARRRGNLVADPGFALRVLPIDVNVSWVIEVGPESRRVTRDGSSDVDCTVTGNAKDLYLDLWNRPTSGLVTVTGDGRPIDIWRERARVTWS